MRVRAVACLPLYGRAPKQVAEHDRDAHSVEEHLLLNGLCLEVTDTDRRQKVLHEVRLRLRDHFCSEQVEDLPTAVHRAAEYDQHDDTFDQCPCEHCASGEGHRSERGAAAAGRGGWGVSDIAEADRRS